MTFEEKMDENKRKMNASFDRFEHRMAHEDYTNPNVLKSMLDELQAANTAYSKEFGNIVNEFAARPLPRI